MSYLYHHYSTPTTEIATVVQPLLIILKKTVEFFQAIDIVKAGRLGLVDDNDDDV